jgi:dipeptidyl aminopeptidase/acylaminoacyl peptidase
MTDTPLLDALIGLPRIYFTLVSPDGQWVAWMWLGVGDGLDVWAAPTDGSQPPIQLCDTPEETVPVSWLPDSSGLIVAQDSGGNERVTLYRIELAQPGVLHPLTPANPEYYIRGGEITPDGRYLVYAANFDLGTGQETETVGIWRQDTVTGERFQLARTEKGGYVIPHLSPDGQHVLYNRIDRHAAGWQLWLCTLDGTSDREIVNLGDDKKSFGTWLDANRIVIIGETSTHNKIGVYSLDDGSITWLIDDPNRSIEGAFAPPVRRFAPLIVVQEWAGARLRCSRLDPDLGIETVLPPMPGNLALLAPVGGGQWVGTYASSNSPTDIVRFAPVNPVRDEFVSLARVWDRVAIPREALAEAEDFRWQASDGLKIQGWLYRARQTPARGTILYIHGGPTAHASESVSAEVQFYVSEGFNVLLPNYRGSTGFGVPFREKIKEDGWGGREQDDITSAARALIEAGIAQAGKIGVTGTSYGGYSSWYQITHAPTELIAAAAPVCGMTDLVVDYETTRPDLRPYSEEMMGGRPDQVPDKYRQASPIHFVHNIRGHLLIVQGMNDPNVTPDNVRVVKEALDDAGVEYGVLAFDDEGHGILKPHNLKVLYPALAGFFARAFEGAPTG